MKLLLEQKKQYKDERREGKEGMKIDLETRKEIAKVAMTATLGATVVTSMFMKNKLSKKIHITAGAAFCGFALWHHLLYKNDKKNSINFKKEKPALRKEKIKTPK